MSSVTHPLQHFFLKRIMSDALEEHDGKVSSERKKKKRQSEEEVGRQYQRVDSNGLCQLN